jgi:hypothetical protein
LTIGGTNTTTINLGASGKSIVIPSGATLTNNGSATGFSGPAFRALATSTSFTASTSVKVEYSDEQFDTDNCYDATTNYRFTPTKAGYYLFNVGLDVRGTVSLFDASIKLYKNGSSYGGSASKVDVSPQFITYSDIASANGTTDYFEVFVYCNMTNPSYEESNDGDCFFSGAWIRGL